jgi:hypothetical protein
LKVNEECHEGREEEEEREKREKMTSNGSKEDNEMNQLKNTADAIQKPRAEITPNLPLPVLRAPTRALSFR